jgi:hypothetical protein
MTARRFVIPKVTEIRVSRGEPQAWPGTALSQRDLVVASILLCPDRKRAGGRARGRSF